MNFTSLDFMKLFSWLAYYKYNTILNKTQMQKLLFIFYGIHLTEKGTAPFDDDSPKAWPHGPVFPRVNARYVPQNAAEDLTEEEKAAHKQADYTLRLSNKVVRRFHDVSAYNLSKWSHKEGGPWWVTLYGPKGENQSIKWNAPISNELIKNYFQGWEKKIDNGD